MTTAPSAAQPGSDPGRYFERAEAERKEQVGADPVCLYLETTNRCNLLCTTCPRTFEDLEPPADMTWELFTRIVDQFPRIDRVVLHGIGEPMLVKALPRMVRYLKDRGTLHAVQHQRHAADREEGPRADRRRASTSCGSRWTPPRRKASRRCVAATISAGSSAAFAPSP